MVVLTEVHEWYKPGINGVWSSLEETVPSLQGVCDREHDKIPSREPWLRANYQVLNVLHMHFKEINVLYAVVKPKVVDPCFLEKQEMTGDMYTCVSVTGNITRAYA